MKRSGNKQGGKAILIGILICMLCAATVLMIVGLARPRETAAAEMQGTVFEAGAVLGGEQALYARSDGGFLLLSANETETRLTRLTQQGAPETGENSLTWQMPLWHKFSTGDALYLVFNTMESEPTTTVYKIPLDSTALSSQLDWTMLREEGDFFIPESICVVDGAYYGILGGVIAYLAPEGAGMPLSLMTEAGDSVEMLIHTFSDGNLLYAVTSSEEAQYTLWSCKPKPEEGFVIGTVLTENLPHCPIAFLGEGMLRTEENLIYRLQGGTWEQTDFLDAAVCGSQITVRTQPNTLSVYNKGAWEASVDTCSYTKPITAMAWSQGVLLVVFQEDGGSYRTVPLDLQHLSGETETSSSDTDPVTPEESSASAAESETGSAPEASLPESSESSEISAPETSEPSLPEMSESTTESSGDTQTSSSEDEEILYPIHSAPPTDPNPSYPLPAPEPERLESGYGVDHAAQTVSLPTGITLAQFRKSCTLGSGSVVAYKPDGTIFTGGVLGTGMQLRFVRNGTLVEQITVITKGDLSGNGLCNSSDVTACYDYLLGQAPLTDAARQAADLDGDGTVDTRDLLLLQKQAA